MSSLSLIVIGSGGHAKVVIDAARLCGFDVVGILDDISEIGSTKFDEKIIGRVDDAPKFIKEAGLFIAIGDNHERMSVVGRVGLAPEYYHTIIHPSACVSIRPLRAAVMDNIGRGVFIGAMANVGPDCKVGNFTIINTRASLDHDSSVSAFSHMAPGSTTGGRVAIGHATLVGINASIRDGRSVGNDCVVGMGAVVTRDIPNAVVGWGNPFEKYR